MCLIFPVTLMRLQECGLSIEPWRPEAFRPRVPSIVLQTQLSPRLGDLSAPHSLWRDVRAWHPSLVSYCALLPFVLRSCLLLAFDPTLRQFLFCLCAEDVQRVLSTVWAFVFWFSLVSFALLAPVARLSSHASCSLCFLRFSWWEVSSACRHPFRSFCLQTSWRRDRQIWLIFVLLSLLSSRLWLRGCFCIMSPPRSSWFVRLPPSVSPLLSESPLLIQTWRVRSTYSSSFA